MLLVNRLKKDKHIFRELLSPEAFFSPKCIKYRLAAGLHPNPLGELTALLKPHSWIYGDLLLRGGRGGERRGVVGRQEGVGGKGSMRHWL